MTLEQFLELSGLGMYMNYRPKFQDWEVKLLDAYIEDSKGIESFIVSIGSTPNAALRNLHKRLSGKRILIGDDTWERRTVNVPQLAEPSGDLVHG